jgi:hypothetical protein
MGMWVDAAVHPWVVHDAPAVKRCPPLLVVLLLHGYLIAALLLHLVLVLLALLCPGLAIYNGHILEFQFPMVLYRKLLDMPLGLGDLEELQPDVARSLSLLLGMSEAEVEALELTFQVRRGCARGLGVQWVLVGGRLWVVQVRR